MAPGSLYILLEGNDDERFFRILLRPYLERKYRKVRFWKYAREKRSHTLKFIKSLQKMDVDFIYVRDIDSAPSVRTKKQEIGEWYAHAVPDQVIVIVVMEIESWYLAGPDPDYLSHFGIQIEESTDTLTKEAFNRLIPLRMSRIEFMNELLKHYSIDSGITHNASFNFFVQRWIRK
jgi:hypothetical protein